MNGIFMAYGPHVRRGVEVEGATMVDVAPTLLYSMGLPVPTNMDGRVLTNVLDPDFVAAHPIQTEAPLARSAQAAGRDYSEDEQAEIAGRLAGLGYIE
jgi:hypothetical protein